MVIRKCKLRSLGLLLLPPVAKVVSDLATGANQHGRSVDMDSCPLTSEPPERDIKEKNARSTVGKIADVLGVSSEAESLCQNSAKAVQRNLCQISDKS